MKWVLSVFALFFLVAFGTIKSSIYKKTKTPPGTVKLNDSLFIDETEIANVHWREFIYALENIEKDSIGAINNLPDTTVWAKDTTITFDIRYDYYFRHPSFNYRPVVGVTYEQAVAFCEWRTNAVNRLFEREPKQNPFQGKKYRYRLPTIEEWEVAASGKLDVNIYPYGFEQMVNKKGQRYANTNDTSTYVYDKLKVKNMQNYPSNVETYLGNSIGAFNMIGNVSEMIATKGVAKGGNFNLILDSCKIKNEQYYTKPEAWLGFRCICEIIN